MSAPIDPEKNSEKSTAAVGCNKSPRKVTDNAVQYLDPKSQSRREFLQGTGAAVVASAALGGVSFKSARAASPDTPAATLTPISLTINGQAHQLQVDARWTLVEVLRDQLNLTGTKIGCDRSECGACTVLMNGKAVYSCSQLAIWADGADVLTVEGLAQNGNLSPLQQAFVDHNGPQCGFCTSGQLMSATALLQNNPSPDANQVRAALVGNLCRCSNYMAIVEAVVATGAVTGAAVAGKLAKHSGGQSV